MKKIILWAVFSIMLCTAGWADTIYLKDGRVIEGEIESQDRNTVVINVRGIPKRFFMQQVDSIERSEAMDTGTTDAGLDLDNPLEGMRDVSEIPQEKIDLILRFLTVDGTRERMTQNIQNAITNAPEEKQDQLRAVINVDEILMELVPLYDNVFKADELEEIILFYESYAGQKLIEIAPVVLNQTVRITYQYVKDKVQSQQ
jgi:sRNA-binding regulator protein Hfq